ncbi:MAG: serine/threonine protein kinase [Planctomycetota bacterium]|jgi:serine/threonine protein kinase
MSAKKDPGFPDIPGYILESVLGRGSMATVYRARQEGMDRSVAVKVLDEAVLANQKIIGRLMREARIAARFNHPHIVRALDAGVHESSCYFVMELIEGQSIRDLLEREGPLTEEQAIELAIEITEALFQLHSEHIIHRDVKPANIMVDGHGNAMLADFGLAKIEFDSSMTSQNHSVGTPAYMSPEQAKNPDGVDARTDLFSLGATLYHMVTGTSPFEGPSVGAVITKILYEEPQAITELNPILSNDFYAIIDKLLSKERDDRYQTSGELLRDLRAIKRGAAPRAAHPRARNGYRSKGVLAVVGGTCAILVVALAFMVVDFDDDEPAVGPQQNPGKDHAESSTPLNKPAAPKKYEEAHVEAVMVRSFDDVRSKIESGRFEAARESLSTECQESFARVLGSDFEELPKWVRIQFENERLKVEQLLGTRERAIASASKQDALVYFRLAAGERASTFPYLTRSNFIAVLEALPQDQTSRFPTAVAAQAREDAVLEIMGDWREDFDREIEKLRSLLSTNDFAGVAKGLDALRQREPSRLGDGYTTRIKSLDDRVHERRGELLRQATNLLATVSMLPPLGSPEIRTREFTPLISRFATFSDVLGDMTKTPDLLMQKFVTVREVLRYSRSWMESALIALENRNFDSDLLLSLTSGRSFSKFVVDQVEGQIISIKIPGKSDLVRFHANELAVECLAAMSPMKGVESIRVRAWLSYCDSDLVTVESTLSELPKEDLFRTFMASRLESAWTELVKVTTVEGKQAFRLWREALVAYRKNKWEDALALVTKITSSKSLKVSPWYRSNRKSIRSIADECRERVEIATMVKEKHGRIEVLSLSPSHVAFLWDFETTEQLKDFQVPSDMALRKGALDRPVILPSMRMSPTDIEPLSWSVPARLKDVPLEVTVTYRTSPRLKESPKFMVFSFFGQHVALLSRLESNPLKHLALHGLEKSLMESVDFGQVVAWSGKLENYRSAFLKSSANSKFKFENNERYVLRFRLDPKASTLSFSINGMKLLEKPVTLTSVQDNRMALRIPMPHRIEQLEVSCGISAGQD